MRTEAAALVGAAAHMAAACEVKQLANIMGQPLHGSARSASFSSSFPSSLSSSSSFASRMMESSHRVDCKKEPSKQNWWVLADRIAATGADREALIFLSVLVPDALR